MLPRLHQLSMLDIGCNTCDETPKRETTIQRMRRLCIGDDNLLESWKAALKWAKDRTSDHVVHMTDSDGIKSQKPLFDEMNDPKQATKYADDQLIEMLNYFMFAREQYLAFL